MYCHSAQLGLFQTLNGVGAACVWVAFFASGNLTVVGTFDSRARRAAVVAAWFVPTGVAFALFLVSLRLVLGSELLKVRLACNIATPAHILLMS